MQSYSLPVQEQAFITALTTVISPYPSLTAQGYSGHKTIILLSLLWLTSNWIGIRAEAATDWQGHLTASNSPGLCELHGLYEIHSALNHGSQPLQATIWVKTCTLLRAGLNWWCVQGSASFLLLGGCWPFLPAVKHSNPCSRCVLCLSPEMLHLPLISSWQNPLPNLIDLPIPRGTPHHASATTACHLWLRFHCLSFPRELKV